MTIDPLKLISTMNAITQLLTALHEMGVNITPVASHLTSLIAAGDNDPKPN